MLQRQCARLALVAIVGCVAAAVSAYEAFQGPTELIQHDAAAASPGLRRASARAFCIRIAAKISLMTPATANETAAASA